MLKSKLLKSLIVGIALVMVFSTAALADTDTDGGEEFTIQIESVKESQAVDGVSDEILEKQKEIDKILFKDNLEKIREKGFTVTHTAPMEDYVEIGIAPYSEENANYIYELIGKDKVKVIEGEQAVLYDTGDAPDAPDAAVSHPANQTAPSSDRAEDTPLVVEDAVAIKTTVDEAESSPVAKSASSSMYILYILGGLIVVAGAVLALRRARAR